MRLASTERTLADGKNELAVRFESPEVDGVQLVKTYTFHRGSYAIDVTHEVVNHSGAPIKPDLYLQLVRDGRTPAGRLLQRPELVHRPGRLPRRHVPQDRVHRHRQGQGQGQPIDSKASHDQRLDRDDPALLLVGLDPAAGHRRAATASAASTPACTASRPTSPRCSRRWARSRRAPARRSRPRCSPARRKRSCSRRWRPTSSRSRTTACFKIIAQPLFWLLTQDPHGHRQLGLVDRRAGGAAEDRVLRPQRQRVPLDGQDEGRQPAHPGAERPLQGQPAAEAAGDDEDLPRGEGQPAGRLPADLHPDADLHRAVHGADVVGRDARRAVDRLDPRPVHHGSVRDPADPDDGHVAAAGLAATRRRPIRCRPR